MQYVSISKYNLAHGIPPIRIQRNLGDTNPIYCNEILINGPSRVVFDPNCVIPVWGVHVAIETEDGIIQIIR